MSNNDGYDCYEQQADIGNTSIINTPDNNKRGRPTNADRLHKQRSSSTSSITDYMKRKRERKENNEEDSPTERDNVNKKILTYKIQTPEREDNSEMTEKNIKELLIEEFRNVKREIQELRAGNKKDVQEWRKEQTEILQRQREENKEIIKKIKEIGEENNKKLEMSFKNLTKELEERICKIEAQAAKENIQEKIREINEMKKDLEKTMEKQEQFQKKNNIIIHGIQVSDRNTKEETEQFLKTELGFNGKIITARKIGYGNNKILPKFNTYEEKLEIMMNKRKLGQIPIYINNDETRKEQEIQRKLRNIAKEKISEGKTAQVSYRKIRIEGKQYTWNEDTKGLTEIDKKPNFRTPQNARNE